jgi:hypothetical protein
MKIAPQLVADERTESDPTSSLSIVSFYRRWRPVFILAGVAALAEGAHLAMRWQLPLPFCLLRRFTGVPCPSCGCTRSLAAWATLDLAQAFRFNPLFFVLCVALLGWSAIRIAETFLQQRFLDGLQLRLRRWPWGKIGLALVALNWLYLCLALPK